MKNKKRAVILGLMLLAGSGAIQAQQGFGTNKPEPSAAVDITSTTQGFLPPRMTSAEMKAIKDPADGLVVYNTELQCLMCYHEGEFTCVDTTSDDNTLASNVAIEGLMRMNDQLTAVYTYSQDKNLAENATTFQWYYANDDNGSNSEPISGATSKTYTISSPVVAGNYVSVGVTPVSTTGKAGPKALSPWRQVVANTAPVFTSVTNAATSATVSFCATSDAQYFDYDGDPAGTPLYRWYRSDDASGTGVFIDGATESTYTFIPDDFGKYIRVGITPTATTNKSPGEEHMASTYLGPVAKIGCGTLKVTHTAGSVAPVTKTVLYETVATNIGGGGTKCWITQNLGADHQATSDTDDTEASAGWYWQFDRIQGYKGTTLTPSNWNGSGTSSGAWTSITDPCPALLGSSWAMPNYTEWENAANSAYYLSTIHPHRAGYLASDGIIHGRGVYGWFWIPKRNFTTTGISLDWSGGNPSASFTGNGYSIRCLSNPTF